MTTMILNDELIQLEDMAKKFVQFGYGLNFFIKYDNYKHDKRTLEIIWNSAKLQAYRLY